MGFFSRRYTSQGVSLIELLMSIVLIGILSSGLFEFVSSSTKGYQLSRDRASLQSQARFVVERIARELRHAVPNSVATFNPIAGQTYAECLIYTPIKYAGIYEGMIENSNQIKVSLSTALSWEAGIAENNIVFNPLKREDFLSGNGPSSSLNSFKIIAASQADGQLTLSKVPSVSWPQVSDSKRLYIYNHSVSFCFENQSLVRRVLDGVSRPQVLSKNLLKGSQFRVLEPSLLQANLIHVDYRFSLNEEISVYNQQIQVTNVP